MAGAAGGGRDRGRKAGVAAKSSDALPSVAVAIVNWNGLEDTLECVRSVVAAGYRNSEVIVVDNGSTDGSVDALRALEPGVRLIELPLNRGFAEGANVAASEALRRGFDFVFLLNNDTTLAPDCLESLVRAHLRLGDEMAVISPRMFFYDSPDEVWHDGHAWNPRTLRMAPLQETPGWRPEGLNLADHVIGTALLIPGPLIRRHGLFDERFFLNYEETDWQFRMRREGVRLFVCTEARLWHKIGRSFPGDRAHRYYMERNRLLWLTKSFGGWQLLSMLVRVEFPRQIGLALKLARRRLLYLPWLRLRGDDSRLRIEEKRAALYGAAMRGWQDFLMGRFGPAPEALLSRSAP